jgi:hypothetical protein
MNTEKVTEYFCLKRLRELIIKKVGLLSYIDIFAKF